MVDSKPLLQDRPPAYNTVPGAYEYGPQQQQQPPPPHGYGSIPPPAPPPYAYPDGLGKSSRQPGREIKPARVFASVSLMKKLQTLKSKSSGKTVFFLPLHAQFNNSFIEICVRKSPTESKHGAVGAAWRHAQNPHSPSPQLARDFLLVAL